MLTRRPPIDISDERDQVTDPSQLALLAEPARYAIYSSVAWGHEKSIREIAERLGLKPSSLYRHIDALVDAGLFEEAGSVETGRRPARLFRARRILKYDPERPGNAEALSQVVERGMRHGAAGFRRVAESGTAVARGDQRNMHFTAPTGWLEPADLARANALIDELRELIQESEPNPGTRLFEVTLTLAERTPAAHPVEE